LTASLLFLLLLAGGDLTAAQKALAAGKPQQALDLLGDLPDRDQPDPLALVVAGRAYLALKEYPAAVEPLLQASDALPEDRALARDAAYACWWSAQGPYAALYLEDAKRMARRAGDPLLSADLAFASGEFDRALDLYSKVANAPASRLRVLMRRAECLERLDRAAEAQDVYAQALEIALQSRDLSTAYRAAFAGGRAGRLLSWLDARIAAKGEGEIEYRRYRGYARAARFMYAEAAQDLQRVVKARPADVDARYEYLVCLLQLGARKQDPGLLRDAEAQGRRILEAQPGHRDTWTRMSWLAGYHWANGDTAGAYEVLHFLHGIDPEAIDTGLNFAAMARRLGHYEEARATYAKLLEISPDDPDVLNDQAILIDGLGDRARAVEIWKRVLAEEPRNLDALENLFTAAWERGDETACRLYLARGLEAARTPGGPLERWLWFQDRLRWAPQGFRG